jgi:creatinine amidohydrolase
VPRYAELHPASLRTLWEGGAPAIVPWGALEWHGDHLPLGLDGLVAEAFAERLSERLNGVLLPGIWLPITTLPHPASLQVRTETLRLILDDVLAGLQGAGAQTIALVTGHYAQGHLIELYEAALRAMEDHPGLRVHVGAPLQPLGKAEVLDHAARFETSQLLALRPELVRADELPETPTTKAHAVLGEHPALGSVREGEQLLEAGLDAWTKWVRSSTPGSLQGDYKREFDLLEPYVEAHFSGSWDDALDSWWKSK